jgi:hypothetical protein
MKKMLVLALVLMVFALAACSSNNNDTANSPQEEQEQSSKNDSNSQTPSDAGEGLVKFPEDYEEGVLYTTVTRGSTFEELYTSREAIEAVQNGDPIPSGTVITLLIYRDGDLSRYFVMEKGTGWGSQYQPEVRNGEWEYQSFTADKAVDEEADIGRCMSCHANRERDDYVNTLDEMESYDLEDVIGSKGNSTDSIFGGISTKDWEVKEVAGHLDFPVDVPDKGSSLLEDKEKDGIIQKVLLTIYFQQYQN